jgi:hypothetical protein
MNWTSPLSLDTTHRQVFDLNKRSEDSDSANGAIT